MKFSLCLLGIGASLSLYAMHLRTAEDLQVQRRSYVRSWMQVAQQRYPSKTSEIAIISGLAAASTITGIGRLWQWTRSQDDLIATPMDTPMLAEKSVSNGNEVEFPKACTEPVLTEVEKDILEFCQKLDPVCNVPASRLQQSKRVALKGLSADEIRSAFVSLAAKGYGTCEGEGKKTTFLAHR